MAILRSWSKPFFQNVYVKLRALVKVWTLSAPWANSSCNRKLQWSARGQGPSFRCWKIFYRLFYFLKNIKPCFSSRKCDILCHISLSKWWPAVHRLAWRLGLSCNSTWHYSAAFLKPKTCAQYSLPIGLPSPERAWSFLSGWVNLLNCNFTHLSNLASICIIIRHW